jgi:hypothetical protein
MEIPVRVHAVCAGLSADDPDRRVVVTCRSLMVATAVVAYLETVKRAGGFVSSDASTQFFPAPTDATVDVESVDAAISLGYQVRSVVLLDADVPTDKVIATIAGAVADPPAPAQDPALDAPAPVQTVNLGKVS